MNNRKNGWGCLTPGGIAFIFAGSVGSYDAPALQIGTIILGVAMLVFPAIAKVIDLKLQNLRPENPPESTAQKRPSLSNQHNFSSPVHYGKARSSTREIFSYDYFGEGHEAGMAAGRQEGWNEGYQEGYDEGIASGYVLGNEEEYGDHIPEGAEWRHPDDDPTAR